jgi:hypothetical protein
MPWSLLTCFRLQESRAPGLDVLRAEIKDPDDELRSTPRGVTWWQFERLVFRVRHAAAPAAATRLVA